MPVLRKIWIVVLCRGLMASGFSLSFPFLALYLSKERGVPMRWVGSFLALSIVSSALAQIVGGSLADRFGRKPVMVLALFSRTALILFLAYAIGKQAPFAIIACLHLISAVGGGLFDPAVTALVSDRFESSQRVEAYGFIRMAGNLGWTVGPALGSLAAGRNYQMLFACTGAVFAVCAVLLSVFVREAPTRVVVQAPPVSWLETLSLLGDDKLRRFCWGVLMVGFAMAQLVAPLSLYAVKFAGLSERELGLLFSLNGAMVVLLQFGVIRVFSDRTLTSMMAAGALLYALGFSSMAFLEGALPLAVAVAVITLGEVTISPTLHAMAANLAAPHLRGRYLGLEGMAGQLGWAMGPLAAGWGLEAWGALKPCPYWFLIGAVALGASRIFLSLRPMLVSGEDGGAGAPRIIGEPGKI